MQSIFDPAPAASGWPAYQHVIFDCDSTLSAIEGIDRLAAEPDTRERIVALTNAAMDGRVGLNQVYGERLSLIAPTRRAVRDLASAYRENLVDGAAEVIAALAATGTDIYIVSGGLLEPVREFGVQLGVPAAHIRAVEVDYDELGGRWWDAASDASGDQAYLAYRHGELAESHGKAAIIDGLLKGQNGASLLVGDGTSDLLARNAVDLFVGFGGIAARDRVRAEAPVYLSAPTLLPVLALALGHRRFYKLDTDLRDRVLTSLASHPPHFNRQVLARRFAASFGGDTR